MRKLIIIATVLFLSNVFITAQNPPPPPAPLIYSAPDQSEIKKYTAFESNFEIDFAGKVETEKPETVPSAIKIYMAANNGSREGVLVGTTKTPLKESEFKDFYETLKKNYLEGKDTQLIYEKAFENKGISGSEFSYTSENTYKKVRVFVVGFKTYVLIADVTNWQILQARHKDKVAEFEAESGRFFDSFQHRPIIIKGERAVPVTVKPNVGKYDSKTDIFESVEGGFKVYFPKRPEKQIKAVPNSISDEQLVIHSANSPAAFYGVTYQDSPTVLTNESDRNINIERQKTLILQEIEAKLKSEKEITVGNYTGKEYEFSNGKTKTTMRIFFVEQRLFRLLIVTTEPIVVVSSEPDGKKSLQIQKLNDSSIKKFYDSFEITKIPKPAFEPILIPDDFGIVIENSKFSSDYFGVEMNLSPDIEIFSEFEANFLKEVTAKTLDETDFKHPEVIKTSLERSKVLFYGFFPVKETNVAASSIIISAESTDFPVFIPVRTLEFAKAEGIGKNESVIGEVKTKKLGGIDFAWYETLDSVTQVRQRYYLANLNQLAFQVFLTYRTQAELAELEKMFNSLKLKKAVEGKK